MKIFKIKNNKEFLYLMNKFPQSIKEDKLEYFIKSKGYKKTSNYEEIETDLPELHNELSWLYICKICEKWGYSIAIEYANQKIAEIVAMQGLCSRFNFYLRVKDLLKEIKDSNEFFEILCPDYRLSLFGYDILNIVELEKYFMKNDKDYDGENCSYKNKENCSMRDYITIRYSSTHAEIVSKLINF
jgi:hypothetical protein